MIRTVIRLLVVLAVANALVRAGAAASSYYQLRDAAEQVILFGAGVQPGELHNRILTKAAELDVPLEPQNLEVRREGAQTFADASYTQAVEFFSRFVYPVDLSFAVEATAVTPPTPDNRAR